MYYLYRVQPGDTLRELAWQFLGSPDAWPQIFEANRGKPQPYGGTLTDPDLIYVGWTMRLRHPVVGFNYSCGC